MREECGEEGKRVRERAQRCGGGGGRECEKV